MTEQGVVNVILGLFFATVCTLFTVYVSLYMGATLFVIATIGYLRIMVFHYCDI